MFRAFQVCINKKRESQFQATSGQIGDYPKSQQKYRGVTSHSNRVSFSCSCLSFRNWVVINLLQRRYLRSLRILIIFFPNSVGFASLQSPRSLSQERESINNLRTAGRDRSLYSALCQAQLLLRSARIRSSNSRRTCRRHMESQQQHNGFLCRCAVAVARSGCKGSSLTVIRSPLRDLNPGKQHGAVESFWLSSFP